MPIPEHWKLVKISDITRHEKHAIVDGPFGTQMKVHEFVDSGIPVIEMQNIKGDKFDKVFRRFITKEKYEEVKRSSVKAGDVLLSKTGSLGYVAQVPPEIENAIITSRLAKISIDWKQIEKNFFLNYLIYLRERGFWEKIAKGTTMKILNVGQLAETEIPLPPIAEQAAIVAKLDQYFSDLDAGVAALRTARAQLKTYRQAVLKYAFEGKLTAAWRAQHPAAAAPTLDRVPAKKPARPFTDAELKDLPALPEGWKWERFGNIVESLKRGPFGSAIKKAFFVKDGYKVYEQQNAIYKSYELGNYYLPEEKFNELQSFEAKHRDYIVSCSGTIGKIFRLPENAPIGVINQALLRIRLDDTFIHEKYFTYLFESTGFQRKITDDAKGTAIKNLAGIQEMKQVSFPLCSFKEQQAIVQEIEDRLSVADKLEETLRASLQQADALRQSLLHAAFTGRLI